MGLGKNSFSRAPQGSAYAFFWLRDQISNFYLRSVQSERSKRGGVVFSFESSKFGLHLCSQVRPLDVQLVRVSRIELGWAGIQYRAYPRVKTDFCRGRSKRGGVFFKSGSKRCCPVRAFRVRLDCNLANRIGEEFGLGHIVLVVDRKNNCNL